MKSNAYIGFSIAIFPVNVYNKNSSKAINVFVSCRKQNIFLHGKISRRRNGVHYTNSKKQTLIYNCQTATLWFSVDISRKTTFFCDFCGSFVYFSLFWIKFPSSPQSCLRVHNHVKNACQWLLITAYFMYAQLTTG